MSIKIFLFILLIFRIILSYKLQLHPDEAYYWLWSRKLDFSYYDHPPMIAYFIRLTTLFSNTEFFVRLSTIISYIVFNIFLYKIGKKFFKKEIAFFTLFLFNSFAANALGFIITPDIPLMLFTILFLYNILSALEQGFVKYWILSGIFCGLALLSKYHGFLLIICMFLVIFFIKEYRKYIFSIYPYLTLFISLFIFLPVLVWNYMNDWISFKYQLSHGLPQQAGNLNNILVYFSGQLVSLGIFLGIIYIYLIFINFFKENNSKIKFFLIYSIFPLLFFALTSYKSIAEMNWPLCAYPSVAMILSIYCFDNLKFKNLLVLPSIFFNIIIVLFLYFHGLYRIFPIEKLNPKFTLTDPTNWFYGWKEFAKFIENQNFEYPLFTTNHQLISELSYYSKNLDIFYDRNQFYIWNKNKVQPLLFYFVNYVSDVSTPHPKDRNFKYEFLKEYSVYRGNFKIRTYNIYLCNRL